MALLFIDGFDHYNDSLDKWDGISGPVSPPGFGTGRFAPGQSVRFTSTNDREMKKTLAADVNEVFLGFGFQTTTGLETQTITTFEDNAGTKCGSIKVTSAGAISVHLGEGGTQLGISAASIISASVWHYIEIHYHPDDSAGVFEVKVDEVSVVNVTGVDTTNGLTHVRAFDIGPHGNPGQDYFFDDLYICDEIGTINNTFLGDVRVATVLPDADTATKDFTPDTGSVNFSRVDESPVIDDDTSYVENGTVGATDLYSFAAVGVTGTVHGIQVNAHARKTDSESRKIKLVAKPGSTESVGPIEHNMPANYFTFSQIYETNPDTSVKWLIPAIDAGIYGMKVTT